MLACHERAQSSPDTNGPTIPGGSRSDESNTQQQHLGQRPDKKAPTQVRIAALNVGGLPLHPSEPKNDSLWQTIRQHDIDVLLMTEVGLNWSQIPTESTLVRRAEKHLRLAKASTAHLRTDAKAPRQWGGTAVLVHGNISGRVLTRSNDPEACGRWSSILLQGRQGIKVRVASVYVPTKSTQTAGTVYNQQAVKAAQRKSTLDPIDLLIHDLQTQIAAWKQSGETIVIGGDINMDVRNSKFTAMMQSNGLHEHHTDRINTPYATMIRNRSSTPIDAIWATPDILPTQLGLAPYADWDHRPVWMDIDSDSLFGSTKQPTTPFTGRRLQLNQPSTVRRYIHAYEAQAEQLHLLQRAQLLDQSINGDSITQAQMRALEQIDKDRTTAMINAELKCRRIRAGHVPFSPVVSKLHWEHRFWTLSIKRRKGHHIKGRTTDKAKKKGGVTLRTKDMTTAEMYKRRNESWKRYNQEKRHAEQHRRSFLSADEAEVEMAGKDSAKYRAQILQREETKATYRRIRWTLHANGSDAQVSIVIDDGPNGSGGLLTSGEEVAQACCANNVDKYSQAWQAEVCQTPLQRLLGRFGTRPGATAILHGIVPSQVRSSTKDMLQALRQPTEATPWPASHVHISPADHTAGWAKIKESTSSGPSGIHFGCWKANAAVPNLAAIDSIMRSIPYRTGYSLKRWQQCVNIQLRKKPGNLAVTKTRTIGLMEGDFNMNNRLLGKQARSHAESNNTIAAEQFGSRRAHTAQEVLVNTVLIDDIARLTGKPYAICSNDAKGCYDRISHSVFSLALQRQGAPKGPITSTLRTLQSMTHRIRTSTGTSRSSYSGKQRHNYLQGLVQGLGSAPTGWLLISSAILDSMRHEGHGLRLPNPVTQEEHTLVGTAYVDDANIMQSLEPASPDTQSQVFQRAVDRWDNLLTATGGALEPTKSFWQLVRFQWKRHRWAYHISQPREGISMNSPSGERIRLTVVSPRTASKYLGMMTRRDGRMTEHTSYLVEKAQTWSESVRTSRISKQDAEIAMTAVLWPSLEYSAPATTMSRQQWHQVMSKALVAALPAMGIARTIAREYVHGPKCFMGLGVRHLHVVQTASHLSLIMRHFEQPTATGRLLRASFQHLTLWTGLPGHLQKHEAIWRQWTNTTWWQHTFSSASDLGITMTLLGDHWAPPREGDAAIMHQAIAAGVPPNTLASANVARIHLRAMWMSDIANAKGDKIRPSILRRERLPAGSITWPATGSVSRTAWEAWETVLSALSAPDRPGWHVRMRLGPWVALPEGRAAVMEDGTIQQTTTRAGRPRSTTMPVQVVDRVVRRSVSTTISSGDFRSPSPPTTLREILCSKGPAASHMVEEIRIYGDVHQIVRSIVSGECAACSDASAKHCIGTAATVVQSLPSNSSHRIVAVMAVPSGSHPTDSNRAELMGVLMSVWITTSVAEWAGVQGRVTVACDNNRALSSVSASRWPEPQRHDFDIWSEIVRQVRASPLTFSQQEVQGHADNEGRELTAWEEMNVTADAAAGHYWEQVSAQTTLRHISGPAQTQGWTLQAGAAPVSDTAYWTLSSRLRGDNIQQKWCSRWGTSRPSDVDWRPMTVVSKKWSGGKRRTLIKLMSGTSASGRNMQRRQQDVSDACPRCGAAEDNGHILVCRSKDSQAIWARAIAKVRSIVRPPTTPPHIAQLLCTALTRISTGGLPPSGIRRSSTQALQLRQHQVGWEAIVWGGWASEWGTLAPPMPQSRRRRAPKLLRDWQVSVTNVLWHAVLEQWGSRNEAKASGHSLEMTALLYQQLQLLKEVPEHRVPAVLRALWRLPPAAQPHSPLILWIQSITSGLGDSAPPISPVLSNWMRNHQRSTCGHRAVPSHPSEATRSPSRRSTPPFSPD